MAALAQGAQRVVRTLWRLARTFLDIQDLFDKRPRGGLFARTLAKLPVVGVAGGWLDERGAIHKAARQTNDSSPDLLLRRCPVDGRLLRAPHDGPLRDSQPALLRVKAWPLEGMQVAAWLCDAPREPNPLGPCPAAASGHLRSGTPGAR